MPELPEVETTRRRVEKALKGKKISHVVPDEKDRIVFDQATPAQFKQALEGAKILGSGRKGKYFWLELNRRPWPVFHLGMTGTVLLRRRKSKFSKAWGGDHWNEAKQDPKSGMLYFCRLRIQTSDGSELAFTDPRRFGRIRLAKDPLQEPPLSKFGFDPLLTFPKNSELVAILQKRKAPIKAVLLDQAVFAGVGNWIADEVLFQAGLSPHRLAKGLTKAEVAKLRLKILSVVRYANKVEANYDRYPRSWLFHHRWGKNKNAATSKKQKILHETIGGRTTAWVPDVQK